MPRITNKKFAIEASGINRVYQSLIVQISKSIEKPTAETLQAIADAENAAFDVELKIGKLFRQEETKNEIRTITTPSCVHQHTCVHYRRN